MSDAPIEAGVVLDRLIAERLGYRLERRGADWFIVIPSEPEGFYFGDGDDYPTLDSAWERAFINVDGSTDIPRHSRDANAALALPISEGASIELLVLSNGKALACIPLNVSSVLAEASPPFEEAATPALAVCRAWLAYCERMKRYE